MTTRPQGVQQERFFPLLDSADAGFTVGDANDLAIIDTKS